MKRQSSEQCSLIWTAWLLCCGFVGVTPGLSLASHTCQENLVPNGSFELCTTATGVCEGPQLGLGQLADWYAVHNTPDLRTPQTPAVLDGVVLDNDLAAHGDNWIHLHSHVGTFSENRNWNEAIGVRLREPLRVGCTYAVDLDAATNRSGLWGLGWLNIRVSTVPVPSTADQYLDYRLCGSRGDPDNGCPVGDGGSPGKDIPGQWDINFGGLFLADKPYQYLIIQATRGHHVQIDNVRLITFKPTPHVSLQLASADCDYGKVTVDGSGSSGPITNHYWEVCEQSEGRFLWCWQSWFSGPPSNFAFPVDFAPCRTYQAKLALAADCCSTWVEDTLTITTPGVPPPAGLRAWWPGDGDTTDYKLNGHDGAFRPVGKKGYVDGIVGQAFDLSDFCEAQYVEAPSSAGLNFDEAAAGPALADLSLDAWIHLASGEGDPSGPGPGPGRLRPIISKLTEFPCPDPEPLCGDCDGDGDVDDDDIACVQSCLGGTCPAADLNNDGVVDEADLAIVSCAEFYGPEVDCCGGPLPLRGLAPPPPPCGRGYELALVEKIPPSSPRKLRLTLADGGPIQQFQADLPSADSNAWHHVAAAVDRDSTTGGRLLWNGQPLTMTSGGATFNPTVVAGSLSNPVPLRIGADHRDPLNLYLGFIDEVELFRRALSTIEIADLVDAGHCGKCKEPERCKLPEVTTVCSNRDEVIVAIKLCNFTTTTQSYDISAPDPQTSDLACGPCTAPNPTGITKLGSAWPREVPPGKCRTATIRIPRPAGLTAGGRSCYEVVMTNVESGRSSRCCGTLVLGDVCPEPGDWGSSPANALAGMISVPVFNGGAGGANFLWQAGIQARFGGPCDPIPGWNDHIHLNGLPPGSPATGNLFVAPGQVANLTMNLGFRAHLLAPSHDLVIEADINGDGTMQPLAVLPLQTQIAAASCPEGNDLNGDGKVDEEDLAILVAGMGLDSDHPQFNPSADLDLDDRITFVDYQIWLACYKAFIGQPVIGNVLPIGPVRDFDDLDNDGIAVSIDNCPWASNPDQSDLDGDGVGDVCDLCPTDPAKTEPGICGCGVADDPDGDADGVADCIDLCPDTPSGWPVDEAGCSLLVTVYGDFDSDQDVDADDYAYFAACKTGPTVFPSAAECHHADYNGDSHIGLDDFAAFQRCYRGADVLVSLTCDD